MLRHSGARPYKCDQCDFACRQSGHLTSHKKKRHGLNQTRIKVEVQIKGEGKEIMEEAKEEEGGNPKEEKEGVKEEGGRLKEEKEDVKKGPEDIKEEEEDMEEGEVVGWPLEDFHQVESLPLTMCKAELGTGLDL